MARRRLEMFQRFTDRARRVVVLAQEEARMLDHNYIGTEHILLGLVREGEGVAAKALDGLGVELDAVRQHVEDMIGRGAGAPSAHIPFTPRSKKILELSLSESRRLGHSYIGTEHILLALVREGEGVAAQVLVRLGADLDRVRHEVVHVLHGQAAGLPRDVAPGPEPSPRGLAELDQRLAAVEHWIGIELDLNEDDQEIARLRQARQSAVEEKEFEVAAGLRDQEKEVLRRRREREAEWRAALAERQSLAQQVGQLAAEVERLAGLLRQHEIDPGDRAV
jgi:hypothetical protein